MTNLVCNEEEHAVDQDAPDSNVGEYTGSQVVGIDSNGTVPVESHKGPCQWSGDNWDMDESWVCVVAEVE
jgi:hypothetical protein